MTSLYVDRRDVHLRHDAGAIVFYENGQRSATVPLAPLTRVILRGKVTLEASLLAHLGGHGIGVLFMTGRQGQPSLLLGRAHNDTTRRVAQTQRSLQADFCLDYARTLVHAKLGHQLQWLDALRHSHPEHRYPLTHALEQLHCQQAGLARVNTLEGLRGTEGAAAACYFAGLRTVVPAALGFHERNRRPPRDPFNALLSLTYTLLMAETAMALHIAGYDPCIGYYHQLSHARESLACDVMEPLRRKRGLKALVAGPRGSGQHASICKTVDIPLSGAARRLSAPFATASTSISQLSRLGWSNRPADQAHRSLVWPCATASTPICCVTG